jgi:hypothetical protein
MSVTCFLTPDGQAPDHAPEMPRLGRRGMMSGFILLSTLLAGGAALASYRDTAVPAQKPGPRRYPPAYRAGARALPQAAADMPSGTSGHSVW